MTRRRTHSARTAIEPLRTTIPQSLTQCPVSLASVRLRAIPVRL